MTLPSGPESVSDLRAFLDASPTPYHAVAEVSRRLRAAGFRELDERDEWRVAPGDSGYVVRGGTIVAFVAGSAPPSRAGFRVIGAHTDSPTLRVKPRGETRVQGQTQLAVEVYGSPLLHTWLDRDLSLAGRVSLIDGSTHLVRFDRSLCRISNLAIHLSPSLATDGLRLNPQQHVVPTLGLAEDDLPVLAELISVELHARGEAEATADAVAAFDLMLYDTLQAATLGAHDEFLASSRIDNLVSCHAATVALTSNLEPRNATRAIVLYDHEEVGSQSATGAGGAFLRTVLERLTFALPGGSADAAPRAFAHSLLVSADMAHAIHPNHADKHDPLHAPKLGFGPVIKVNAGQSYATDAPGAAAFERACREAGFSAQRFVARNDMRCGSTIGPISASRLGMRTVDVGSSMLSMHSCREVTATSDVPKLIQALARMLEADAPPFAV